MASTYSFNYSLTLALHYEHRFMIKILILLASFFAALLSFSDTSSAESKVVIGFTCEYIDNQNHTNYGDNNSDFEVLDLPFLDPTSPTASSFALPSSPLITLKSVSTFIRAPPLY